MEQIRDILLQNAKEYYFNAIAAEKKGQYNSAVTLFFKAISALCDLYILMNMGRTPTNHTDRFRILENDYPSLYRIIDKNFPHYQDSYTARLTKEVSDMLKEDARRLFEILKIRV